MEQALNDSGLTQRIEESLRKHGKQDVISLARELGVQTTLVSRTVWTMYDKKLVERDEDGRYSLRHGSVTPIIPISEIKEKHAEASWRNGGPRKDIFNPRPKRKKTETVPAKETARKVTPIEQIEEEKPVTEERTPQMASDSHVDDDAVFEDDMDEQLQTNVRIVKEEKPKPKKKPEPKKTKPVEAKKPAPKDEGLSDYVREMRERREKQKLENARIQQEKTQERKSSLNDLIEHIKRCVNAKSLTVDDAFEIFAFIIQKLKKA